MFGFIGIVALGFIWRAMAALNKEHVERTGVNMPTRSAMKRMRHDRP